jgi:signal transduction histidine kinase
MATIAAVGCTAYICYFGYYVVSWIRNFYKWKMTADTTSEQALCITHLLLYIFYLTAALFVWIIAAKASPLLHFNEPVLTTLVAFHTIIILVSTVMPSRSAHRKAGDAMYLELQIKAKFMRYITHEIRNPTSIVSTTLELLKTKLESFIQHCTDDASGTALIEENGEVADKTVAHSRNESRQAFDRDRVIRKDIDNYRGLLSLVTDAQTANNTALEVLNEFLVFDKLTSKMMHIEAAFVNRPRSLIKSMVHPFYVAARQKGIHLHMRTVGTSEDIKLLERLFLVADVGKIGQVMRNFLSNAIKFTKPTGHVTVTISWCDRGSGNREVGGGGTASTPPAALLVAGSVPHEEDTVGDLSRQSSSASSLHVSPFPFPSSSPSLSPIYSSVSGFGSSSAFPSSTPPPPSPQPHPYPYPNSQSLHFTLFPTGRQHPNSDVIARLIRSAFSNISVDSHASPAPPLPPPSRSSHRRGSQVSDDRSADSGTSRSGQQRKGGVSSAEAADIAGFLCVSVTDTGPGVSQVHMMNRVAGVR